MKESVLMHKSSRTIDAGKRKNHFSHANISLIQRHVNMRGHIYDYFTDFTEAFAKHFRIRNWEIPQLIWNYLVLAFYNDFYFASYNDIIANVIPQQNRHLPINLFYMISNSRCTINMTGSRNADYQQANLFYQNPGNLIWHHIEGVRYNRGNYNCDMILTIPMYHAQQHIGAVKEYEILTGNHYNP